MKDLSKINIEHAYDDLLKDYKYFLFYFNFILKKWKLNSRRMSEGATKMVSGEKKR